MKHHFNRLADRRYEESSKFKKHPNESPYEVLTLPLPKEPMHSTLYTEPSTNSKVLVQIRTGVQQPTRTLAKESCISRQRTEITAKERATLALITVSRLPLAILTILTTRKNAIISTIHYVPTVRTLKIHSVI